MKKLSRREFLARSAAGTAAAAVVARAPVVDFDRSIAERWGKDVFPPGLQAKCNKWSPTG